MPEDEMQPKTIETRCRKLFTPERCLAAAMLLFFVGFGLRSIWKDAGWSGSEVGYSATDLASTVGQQAHNVSLSPLTTLLVSYLAPYDKSYARSLPAHWISDGIFSPVRLTFLAAGVLLGISLCYVTRKFFGRRSGLIALGVYCGTYLLIFASCEISPAIFAAWGSYGIVFTAIATAHTLYAPREVILWNWKRIVFLGISIMLVAGSFPPLLMLLLPALGFMLWAVPHRRKAALAIFAAACGVAMVLLGALVLALPRSYWNMARQLGWLGLPSFGLSRGWDDWAGPWVSISLIRGLGILALSLMALVAFGCLRKTRFFGNFAPLLCALLLLPFVFLWRPFGDANICFLITSLPFLITFIVGVEADLHERWKTNLTLIPFALAVLWQLCLFLPN